MGKIILVLLFIIFCIDCQLIYSPFEESSVDLDDICNSGIIRNEKAIIAESGAGIKVFDIKNIQKPKLVFE